MKQYTYDDFIDDLKAACEECHDLTGWEMAEEPGADSFVEEEFDQIWEGR